MRIDDMRRDDTRRDCMRRDGTRKDGTRRNGMRGDGMCKDGMVKWYEESTWLNFSLYPIFARAAAAFFSTSTSSLFRTISTIARTRP
jgi:hypothetical protein